MHWLRFEQQIYPHDSSNLLFLSYNMVTYFSFVWLILYSGNIYAKIKMLQGHIGFDLVVDAFYGVKK
jgi:hypothetical protein